MTKRYLSPQDVADQMGWNRETVYLKLKAGEMPGFTVNGRWYIKPKEFDDWCTELERKNRPAEPLA